MITAILILTILIYFCVVGILFRQTEIQKNQDNILWWIKKVYNKIKQ